MIFASERVYLFTPKKGWKVRLVKTVNRAREFAFLRRVGKIYLFTAAGSGCLESFTLQQLEDFDITEVGSGVG